MSDVPMPRDFTEEEVAAFMREVCCLNVQRIPAAELRAWEHASGKEGWRIVAAHVLAMIEADRTKHRALLREKVREAVDLACRSPYSNTRSIVDHIVSRVLGEEAPRG